MAITNTTPATLAPFAAGDNSKTYNQFFTTSSTSNTSHTFVVGTEPIYLEAYNLGMTDTITVQIATSTDSGQFAPFCPIFGPMVLNTNRTKINIDWPGVYRLVHTGSSVIGSFTVVGYSGTMTQERTTDLADALYAVLTTLTPPPSLSTHIDGILPIVVTGTGTTVDPFIISYSNTVQTVIVEGSSPIQVTGIGTTLSPYIVSFNGSGIGGLVDVIGTAPITVTGNGATLTPYNIGINLATNAQEEAASPPNYVISAGVLAHIVNAQTANQSCYLGVGATCASIAVSVGYNSVSAFESTAIGPNSFSTRNSVAIGPFAGPSTGVNDYSRGVFIGYQTYSIGSTANATDITAVGYNVMVGSDPITGATAIGSNAANGVANFNGVAVGYNAGHGAVSSLENAVCIGNGAAFGAVTSDCVIVGHSAGHDFVGDGVIVGATAATGASQFSGITVGANSCSSSMYVGNAVVVGQSAATGIDYTAEATNLPFPIPTPLIVIGNNAGISETHYDVTIIGSNGDGSSLNATQNHQIILGNTTQTQLVTAGSVIQGGVITPSDNRLKIDIKPYNSGLDGINKLNPVSYRWDPLAVKQGNIAINQDELEKTQLGLIAQELEEVFPDMIEVVDRGFGKYKYARYDRLIPVLLSAVKQLAAELDELKQKAKKNAKPNLAD